MGNDQLITIQRKDLIEALRYLSEIVVSLDRIGSCYEDVGKEEYERMTLDYLDKWNVWGKLSTARMRLSEPFSRELGDDGMEELERQLDDIRYWSLDQREPRQDS